MNKIKIYEKVFTKNFLYKLGFTIQAKSNCTLIPSAFNLLQQAPTDKKLNDVLLEFPGIVRLIEFKQANSPSTKERARHILLKAAIGNNEEMIRLSKSIHWFVETNPDNKTFVSRIIPYLDAYIELKDDEKYSFEQFIEAIAVEAIAKPAKFSIEALRHYLSFIAICQGSGKVGTGGLLLAINAEEHIRFTELEDMMSLRLQHRAFVEQYFNNVSSDY